MRRPDNRVRSCGAVGPEVSVEGAHGGGEGRETVVTMHLEGLPVKRRDLH